MPDTYRFIVSEQRITYMLTPDTMHTTSELISAEGYRYLHAQSPSLSRVSARRIFKTGAGKCMVTRKDSRQTWKTKYRYTVTPDRLKIGCQSFTGANLMAIRSWVGSL